MWPGKGVARVARKKGKIRGWGTRDCVVSRMLNRAKITQCERALVRHVGVRGNPEEELLGRARSDGVARERASCGAHESAWDAEESSGRGSHGWRCHSIGCMIGALDEGFGAALDGARLGLSAWERDGGRCRVGGGRCVDRVPGPGAWGKMNDVRRKRCAQQRCSGGTMEDK